MSVLQHFEEYQKARIKFVQAVAEAATRPQNIEVMNNAGVMQLLRPLLLDNVSSDIAYQTNSRYKFSQPLLSFVSPRFQVYNRLLLWHWSDWPTTVKIWQRR